MAKANTTIELIQSATEKFDQMMKMINSLTEVQQQQNFTFDSNQLTAKDGAMHWQRDHNIRDVLVHLYEWHQLLIIWIKDNQLGLARNFLPLGITWTNYQKMNNDFFQKHQSTTLEQAKDLITNSHKQVIKLLETFTDEQLFTKKYFKWTGSTSLGQYCHSATVAHYEWALKKLKIYKKNLI